MPCRLHFPQLALRRRLGQLSCMSRPALKLRSWPLTVLYYLLPFGALRPLSRVGWRPVSRVSVHRLLTWPTPRQPKVGTQETVVRLEVMAVGAEPSGRIMLKGDMVERAGLVGVCVGGRKVTEGSLFTACCLHSAPFGGCASGGNSHWTFRKWCLMSSEVILRRIQINYWMTEGGSGSPEPVWAL